MKVMFDEEALEDLQTIFAWIAKDDLSAAKRLWYAYLIKWNGCRHLNWCVWVGLVAILGRMSCSKVHTSSFTKFTSTAMRLSYFRLFTVLAKGDRGGGAGDPRKQFALVRRKRTFAPEPTCKRNSAPDASVKVGRRPPHSGRLDPRAGWRATIVGYAW